MYHAKTFLTATLFTLTTFTAFAAAKTAPMATMTPVAKTTPMATLTPAADTSSPGAALINKLTRGQVSVTQTFPVTGTDLTGYVVSPKNGGHSMIMYTNATGDYLFVGNLVDQNGSNLTEQYTDQYVNQKLAAQAQNSIATQTNYFTQGSDKAPHKMYVFFDPNCSACNMFYKTISSEITKGTVQIRWVPVAFLKASSDGIAANILSGKNDADRASLLKIDETGFKMSTEDGGLTPLTKNKDNQKLFDMVKQNTNYFGSQGFYVTPTILYKKPDGTAGYTAGAIPAGAPLNQFLSQVGNNW